MKKNMEGDIDHDIINHSDSSSSKIMFEKPIHPRITEKFLFVLEEEYVSRKQKEIPELKIIPIENRDSYLIGIDFATPLNTEVYQEIQSLIPKYINLVLEQLYGKPMYTEDGKKKPTSFTEILGTYRIQLSHIFIPILICICSAMFLGWLVHVKAGIVIDYSPVPVDENPTWDDLPKILINGIIPVVGSAIFVTILWFLIKRYGMGVFKIIMGVLVLFYTWYGFYFFITTPFIIFEEKINSLPILTQNIIYLFDWVLVIGSAIFFLLVGIRFFKNKLNSKSRNLLVLTYGIFMGAILGISFREWTIISFAIFLSIWDIITVFYGPLGKIANQLKENQKSAHNEIQRKIVSGEINQEEASQLNQFVELQDINLKETKFWDLAQKIEIELGSGDLILYSALVANAFITTGNWVITGIIIAGVMLGVFLTLYILVKKRKMLPALPISMAIGVTIYIISLLIVS